MIQYSCYNLDTGVRGDSADCDTGVRGVDILKTLLETAYTATLSKNNLLKPSSLTSYSLYLGCYLLKGPLGVLYNNTARNYIRSANLAFYH